MNSGFIGKVKVLWLVDHLGYDGAIHGAGKYYLNTVPLFDKNRFDVNLCVLRRRDSLTKLFEKADIEISHLSRSKFNPFTLLDILSLTRREKIDLLHCHGYGASNFGRLAGAISRIPTIVHAHDEDTNYPWYQALADLSMKGLPYRTIAISQAVKVSCIKKRKMSQNQVALIYNAIPLEEFKMPPLREIQKQKCILGVDSSDPIIGSIAKLREEKGIAYLIQSATEVLKVFKDAVFVIVGDGPLRGELENLSRRLGIDKNVLFLGFQPDIPRFLSVFDVMVQPSLYEGFGLAIVEAMAMGKPIVATNVGGIREILRDGETGYLVPPKDPSTLADRVLTLIRDKQRAMQMGNRAKVDSIKYDIRTHVRTLETEYLSLVSSA